MTNAQILNVLGILLTTIGTILTIWTIMHADPRRAGTVGEMDDRKKEFPKEQRLVKAGYTFIVFGAFLQIVGQLT